MVEAAGPSCEAIGRSTEKWAWWKRALLALSAIVVGVVLSERMACAQNSADARNAAELQRLIGVATKDKDVEVRIASAQAALKLEPRIKKWSLSLSRPFIRGALLQIMGTDLVSRPTGNHEDNLDQAIAAYQSSLRVLTKDVSSGDWGTTQNNLGLAYLQRSRGGGAANNDHAIAAFQAALTVFERGSQEWANAWFNLGLAYDAREEGGKAENLEKAIEAYRDALTVYTLENTPDDWAKAQAHLGQSLINRVAGVKSENIDEAIALFESTLQGRSREALGDELWAGTQRALAGAYRSRVHGDPASNTERAIKGYEAALTVYTQDAVPLDWANLQVMLAYCYSHRVQGSEAENREKAIDYFEAALTVYTRESTPYQWAETQYDLAGQYMFRPNGYASENTEKAIAGFKAALSVLTRESAPEEWSGAQEALGMAYIRRSTGDKAENLEQGIDAYNAALSVLSRDSFPETWAHVEANLSKAYAYRIRGDSKENLSQAIEAARNSIEVYSPETHPSDFLSAVRLLGPAYVQTKNFEAAASIYAEARKTFLLLFGGGLDEAEARSVLTDVGPLFSESAYVAAEQGQNATALALLNEGKARLMAAALRQRTLKLSPEDRERYQKLRAEMRRWSQVAAEATGVAGVEAVQNLEASRNELAGLIEKGSSETASDDNILDWIAPLVPEGGAIVAPIVTFFGGKILIVTRGANGPDISVASDPDLSTEHVRQFLRGDSADAVGGWLGSYAKNYEMQYVLGEAYQLRQQDLALRREAGPFDSVREAELSKQFYEKLNELDQLGQAWRGDIDSVSMDMWRLFAGQVHKALEERGIAPGSLIVWMPPGGLGVLPLGLAQDPDSKRRFSDDYAITYVPSLVALKTAKDELTEPTRLSLAVAADPTGDLEFAEDEGSIVASHFDPAARVTLRKSEATPEAVLAALKGKTYWHFATHGSFSWTDALGSGLTLSNGNGGRAPLTIRDLADIEELDRPRLVVLSACETGLYESRENPDEFTGLPGAFISLGAQGVLSTLWPVDDRASMLLTSKFYDFHLRDALPPPEALRRAQMWLRDAKRQELVSYVQSAAKVGRVSAEDIAVFVSSLQHNNSRSQPAAGGTETEEPPPFAHPYFWGAFIYSGI